MTTPEFIKKYKLYAILEHIRTGVPASITLSQGIIESNSGNSALAQHNNFFGIKAYSNPDNLPVVYLNDDTANEPFRTYKTPWQGFRDHSNFLLQNPRYILAFQTKNYIEFAKALKEAGYATASNYATSLANTVASYSLHKYDFWGDNKYIIAFILLLIISAIIFSVYQYKSKNKKHDFKKAHA